MSSPYMTTEELAVLIRVDHTKYPRMNARKFIRRHGIPTFGARPLLVLKSSVIDALHEAATRRQKTKRTT